MGAAYERGFSKALVEYVDNYNNSVKLFNKAQDAIAEIDANFTPAYQKEIAGFEIESNVDLAAFHGYELPADKNANSNYFMRSKNDIVAGYNEAKVPDAIEIGVNSNGQPKSKGHHASAYPVGDLPSSNKNGSKNEDINENP